MPFLDELIVRVENDHTKTLVEDFKYHSPLTNKTYFVRAGFKTDFASVPRLPITYLVAGGHGEKAAVIHDHILRYNLEDRETADNIFYEALIASGENPTVARLMYLGVRFARDEPIDHTYRDE